MAGFGTNDEVVSPQIKPFGANDEVVSASKPADATISPRRAERAAHSMTGREAPPKSLPAQGADFLEAMGTMAAPAALPGLAFAPAATLAGAGGAYVLGKGGNFVADKLGASPDEARLAGDLAAIPGGMIGGGIGESPWIRSGFGGAVRAVPEGIRGAVAPGAASYVLRSSDLAPLADAYAAYKGLSPVVRGFSDAASGKPALGPIGSSLRERFLPSERSPQRPGPLWQNPNITPTSNIPAVAPLNQTARRALSVPPEMPALPSGRLPGPRPPQPTVAPPVQRQPLWATNPEIPAGSPTPFAPIPATELPSGRAVGRPVAESEPIGFLPPFYESAGPVRPPLAVVPREVPGTAVVENPPMAKAATTDVSRDSRARFDKEGRRVDRNGNLVHPNLYKGKQ